MSIKKLRALLTFLAYCFLTFSSMNIEAAFCMSEEDIEQEEEKEEKTFIKIKGLSEKWTKENEGSFTIKKDETKTKVSIILETCTQGVLKDIRNYATMHPNERSYGSLSLSFLEENTNDWQPTMVKGCYAEISAIYPNVAEFIYKGPFVRGALPIILLRCTNIKKLSLISENLKEILNEIYETCPKMLKTLMSVGLTCLNDLDSDEILFNIIRKSPQLILLEKNREFWNRDFLQDIRHVHNQPSNP